MNLPDHLQFLVGSESFQAKLPNRLVHPQAWGMIPLLALGEQMLLEQGGHQVQYLCALAPKHAIDSLRCFKRTAAREGGKQAKEALLAQRKQVVAPGDGLVQRLLTEWQIAW